MNTLYEHDPAWKALEEALKDGKLQFSPYGVFYNCNVLDKRFPPSRYRRRPDPVEGWAVVLHVVDRDSAEREAMGMLQRLGYIPDVVYVKQEQASPDLFVPPDTSQ